MGDDSALRLGLRRRRHRPDEKTREHRAFVVAHPSRQRRAQSLSWPTIAAVLAEARALAEALIIPIDVGEARLFSRDRSPAMDRQADGDIGN